MNLRHVFLALLCCSMGIIAHAQDSWDLKRSVQYALDNNISVKQADIQARLAELSLKQNRLMQYPSANISGSVGVNAGRSIYHQPVHEYPTAVDGIQPVFGIDAF